MRTVECDHEIAVDLGAQHTRCSILGDTIRALKLERAQSSTIMDLLLRYCKPAINLFERCKSGIVTPYHTEQTPKNTVVSGLDNSYNWLLL